MAVSVFIFIFILRRRRGGGGGEGDRGGDVSKTFHFFLEEGEEEGYENADVLKHCNFSLTVDVAMGSVTNRMVTARSQLAQSTSKNTIMISSTMLAEYLA